MDGLPVYFKRIFTIRRFLSVYRFHDKLFLTVIVASSTDYK